MDLFGPRAIPPLTSVRGALVVFLACSGSAFAAGTACDAIEGTYRNADKKEPPVRWLDGLTRSPAGKFDPRLLTAEEPAGGGRPKFVHLASTGTLTARPDGLLVEFRDAGGQALATLYANFPRPWTCKDGQFQWEAESTHGLGDNTALVKTRGNLARAPNGDLVMTEDRDDPREQSIKRIEVRFAPAGK